LPLPPGGTRPGNPPVNPPAPAPAAASIDSICWHILDRDAEHASPGSDAALLHRDIPSIRAPSPDALRTAGRGIWMV